MVAALFYRFRMADDGMPVIVDRDLYFIHRLFLYLETRAEHADAVRRGMPFEHGKEAFLKGDRLPRASARVCPSCPWAAT
ncbi:hypothetical protein YK56LOC_15530 [Caballeronia sp. HLA56]